MKHLLPFLLLIFTILAWSGCQPDEEPAAAGPSSPDALDAALANDWFALTLDLTQKTPGFSPPVAARAFGYTGLTLYESLVHGMPEYQSLQGHINGLSPGMLPEPEAGKAYHWGVVANRALSLVVFNLYRNASIDELVRIGQLEQQYEQLFKKDVGNAVFARSLEYGDTLGRALYAYAKSDGQDQAYQSNFPASYVAPVFDGCWIPTPPAYGRPLQPYWGQVRTFVAKNATETLPSPHPTYSVQTNSHFYLDALEVYNTVKNLTPSEKTIAEYWSDDPGKTATPPGHSISMLRQVLEKEDAKLSLAAEAYARVGMAVHDAFVSCWRAKYIFCLMRPVTYIRNEIDPNFSSLLTTPPFPEYTSGHSVQSGASAEVLTALFGPDYAFTDHTHENRTDINGTPRTFPSFDAAAEEAAISRLYGGIHYRFGIEEGVVQGRKVGKNINELPFRR